jgi:hypothetical protein
VRLGDGSLQVRRVVLRTGTEDPHGVQQGCARVARAPIVVLDRFDVSADRCRVEAACPHQRHLGRERAQHNLVAAAAQVVQNRGEREQVPARGRGVGEDARH